MKKATVKQAVTGLKQVASLVAERDQNAHYCVNSSPLMNVAVKNYQECHKGDANDVYQFMLGTRELLEKEISKRYRVKYLTGPAAMTQDITALYHKRKVSRVLAIASGIIDSAIGNQARKVGEITDYSIGNGLNYSVIKM